MNMEEILDALSRSSKGADSPFTKPRSLGNLVSGLVGRSKDEATHSLQESQYNTAPICFACGCTAKYRVVPKEEINLTAEIQKGVYICEHHANTQAVDPKLYGLQKF